MRIDISDTGILMVPCYILIAQFSHLIFEDCHSELLACLFNLVILGIAFSFMKLIFSFYTWTMREAAILKKMSSRYNHLTCTES